MKSPRVLVAAVSLAAVFSVRAAPEKPNVLLICVDDLKPLLGCYGDAIAKTPNIDKLAGRSTLFTQAYCNQAVCAPSRNALITGLRPDTIGIYDLGTNFRLAAPDVTTLPQTFLKNGYHTSALGKILHTGHGNHEDKESWSVPPWKPKAPQYVLKESTADMKSGKNGNRGNATESAEVSDNTYADGKIAEEAIARLEVAKGKPDEPFFLAVGFLKPHLPFVAPKKYWDLYKREEVPLAEFRNVPENAPSYAPQFGGELHQYAHVPAEKVLPEEFQRELVHGYYAATSYVDAQIGKVLDALEEYGLSENTIVVLWGDHGWHLGDHGMWCKHTNYEQAARIPLLISKPGAKPGSGVKSRAFAETVDLYPTLCEIAGIEAPDGLDGISLVKNLEDPSTKSKGHVIHVYPRGKLLGRAIRTDRFRLVEWKEPGAPPESADLELYDYEDDPLETKNIAAEKPETVSELRAILSKYPEAKPQFRSEGGNKEPGGKKKTDRTALFTRRDADKDDKLTLEEFMKYQPDDEAARKRFPVFDKDGDGLLTRDEFGR